MQYTIYTDGSTSGNGKEDAIGGWAYLILNDEAVKPIRIAADGTRGTTNNIMELTAVVEALKYISSKLEEDDMVDLYTDSAYIQNCYSQKWWINWQKNGWKTANKSPVKNKELWEQLIPFFLDNRITLYKVKGHDTNQYNNFVDNLATSETLKLKQEETKKCLM